MAETLTAQIDARVSWNFKKALDNSTTKDQDKMRYLRALAAGTGDNQVDQMWHDQRTLSPGSTTDDLDLAGGLTNVFGTTVTFAVLKVLYVHNLGVRTSDTVQTPTDGEDLQVGGQGTEAMNAWLNANDAAELTLRSGGELLVTAPMDGYTVTAGTADILRILHDGIGVEDIVYNIFLAGVKA